LHSDFELIAYFGTEGLNFSQPPLDFVAVLGFGPRLFGFPQGMHGEFHPPGSPFRMAFPSPWGQCGRESFTP
jgi:hypothetical protein